jgi:phage replication O-like protein O
MTMANPQLENGHIRLANELYREALLRLPSAKFKVWFAYADLTYGWGKKRDHISYSQVAAAAGITPRDVRKHARELIEWNVLIREPWVSGTIPVIGLNKDYEAWILPGMKLPGYETAGVDIDPGVRNETTGEGGTKLPAPPVENYPHHNHVLEPSVQPTNNQALLRPLSAAYLKAAYPLGPPQRRDGFFQKLNQDALKIEAYPGYDEKFALGAIKTWFNDECVPYQKWREKEGDRVTPLLWIGSLLKRKWGGEDA